MQIVNCKGEPHVIPFKVGTGGLTKGDLAVYSSSTAIKATDPITAFMGIGIALETKAADAYCPIAIITSATVVQAAYTGSSKTSLTEADIGKTYDLSDEVTVDLDDTTGGCAICVGYDNDNDTINFIMPSAIRMF